MLADGNNGSCLSQGGCNNVTTRLTSSEVGLTVMPRPLKMTGAWKKGEHEVKALPPDQLSQLGFGFQKSCDATDLLSPNLWRAGSQETFSNTRDAFGENLPLGFHLPQCPWVRE